MKTINKKLFFVFTLIFLLCLSISSIYAEELSDDYSDIYTISDLSDLKISDNEVSLEDSQIKSEYVSEKVLNEEMNYVDDEQLMLEDYSVEDNPLDENSNEIGENLENINQNDSENELLASSKKSYLGDTLNEDSGVEIHDLKVNYTDGKIEFKVHFTNGYTGYVGFIISSCNNDFEDSFGDYVDQNGYVGFSIHLKPDFYHVSTTYYPDCPVSYYPNEWGVVLSNYIRVLDYYQPYGFKNLYLKSFTFYYGTDREFYCEWVGTLNAQLKIYKGKKIYKNIKINPEYGIESWVIGDFPAGTYTLKIVGNNGIVFKQSTLKILKMKTYLDINSLKVKPKSKRYVTVRVRDYYGWLYLNGYVKFKLKGKVYKVKVRDGIGKIRIKMPSKCKTFRCIATFYGNKNLIKSSTKFKITVKKPKKTKTTKKAKAKKKSNLKSLTLKVSSNRYHSKNLKNGDTISNFYSTYDGQYSPGIHVEAGYFNNGPDNPRHTKLVKAKVWFKNSYGKVVTRTVKRNGYYIKINRISGYSPYKVKVYYKNK